jgi:hypothetical protein
VPMPEYSVEYAKSGRAAVSTTSDMRSGFSFSWVSAEGAEATFRRALLGLDCGLRMRGGGTTLGTTSLALRL